MLRQRFGNGGSALVADSTSTASMGAVLPHREALGVPGERPEVLGKQLTVAEAKFSTLRSRIGYDLCVN